MNESVPALIYWCYTQLGRKRTEKKKNKIKEGTLYTNKYQIFRPATRSSVLPIAPEEQTQRNIYQLNAKNAGVNKNK